MVVELRIEINARLPPKELGQSYLESPSECGDPPLVVPAETQVVEMRITDIGVHLELPHRVALSRASTMDGRFRSRRDDCSDGFEESHKLTMGGVARPVAEIRGVQLAKSERLFDVVKQEWD